MDGQIIYKMENRWQVNYGRNGSKTKFGHWPIATAVKVCNESVNELMLYMKGWWGYYNIIESKTQLSRIDNWIRRRLRMLLWKQWKNRRTRVGELLKRGIERNYAVTTGCAWCLRRSRVSLQFCRNDRRQCPRVIGGWVMLSGWS